MMWRTHLMAGLNTLWLLHIPPDVLNPDSLLPLLSAASLGALLPDLDARESKFKSLEWQGVRPFAPLSVLLHTRLGHRGPLHSLTGWFLSSGAATTLALLPAVSGGPSVKWATLAFALGYGSHLVADACTRSGIPFFYVPRLHPDRRRYHLLPPRLSISTGSFAEDVLLFVLLLNAWLLCYLLLVQIL